MTDTVTITNDGRTVTLSAPFDPAFPAKARKIGGRFDPAPLKVWRFDARDEQRVRALAREFWGTDGSDADEPTVTVRVPLTPIYAWREQEYRLAGRRLAWRAGRDEQVRLADGVVVVAGEFPSRGGSVRNPSLGDYGDKLEEIVLEVRDVPRSVAEKMRAEQADATVLDAPAVDREALQAERAQLAARLAEIDALLND